MFWIAPQVKDTYLFRTTAGPCLIISGHIWHQVSQVWES